MLGYNRQYGTQFLAAMPTNLYGPHDNFDLKTSHVLPALMRKVVQAKAAGRNVHRGVGHGDAAAGVAVQRGSGGGVRLPDAASDEASSETLIHARMHAPLINIGTGEDVTIRELAELVARELGFDGELKFDTTKPDGTPRKLMDVSRIHALGWRAKTQLPEGIRKTYAATEEQLRA